MRRALAQLVLMKLWGWKFETVYPKHIESSVVIVLPHTSYWDFPIGVLLRPIIHFDTKFVAKHTLFKFPLGIIMRGLNGLPVNRTKSGNFIDAVADQFKKDKKLILTISPEGTRTKVTKLKRGFYFIAMQAGVPIVCCKFDWSTKTIGFSGPFYPTGDYDADLPKILEYYRGVKGYRPAWDFEIP